MTKHSISAQIQEVEYELMQRRSVYPRLGHKSPSRQSELDEHMARMESVKRTLEWVQENEAKIKATMAVMEKRGVAEAMPEGEPARSGKVYHQRVKAFLDYSRGGWGHLYDILDGDKVIGSKMACAQTRSSPVVVTYTLGDQQFLTAQEFIAAYEATLEGKAA